MTVPTHRVRRATLDDLDRLKALWESMRLPADELERRLTEFQVVESPDTGIIGGIGVQIAGHHACLHSEVYDDFGLADQVRPLLFERIQSLASNHGVFRLWMPERSPFWTQQGFKPASDEALGKLPEPWRAANARQWVTLQLKDEDAIVSMEKEFELYRQAEQLRTARTLAKAHLIRTIITVLGFAVGIVLIAVAVYIYIRRQRGL